MTPFIGKEDDFQISACKYLTLRGVLFNHCPNGGYRNTREAVKLKRMGTKAGFPDISILHPNKEYNGLFIELKVGSNKPRDNQKEWMSLLNEKGYKATWTNSLDDFMNIVDSYLLIPKNTR